MKKITFLVLILGISISLSGCSKEYKIDDELLVSQNIDDNYREYYEIFVGAF
ncbi:hypothetical protein KHQ89_07430 [Mycoplasmatota bacterium]|nr:hypothetical protein KHQ89_07430 [Mycoplasmatota bacterium]